MTDQIDNSQGLKTAFDGDDADDSDVAFDFSSRNDIEPAIYPSAARMKRYADLSIPADELTIISDDESDGEASNSEEKKVISLSDNTNETVVNDDSPAIPVSLQNQNSRNLSKDIDVGPDCGDKLCDKTPTPPTSATNEMNARNETIKTKEKETEKEDSSNVSQNICSDDPNLPNISVVTQTRNTSTSVITTTTTTIVTRKRSSSESNNSKSSHGSNASDCSGSSHAKKRKKSDVNLIEEEDGSRLRGGLSAFKNYNFDWDQV